MKDVAIVESNPEHTYAKSISSTPATKTTEHGYAKSSSSKKQKKQEILDPKQRKLSFTKIPKPDAIVIDLSSSDSDDPLSTLKNGKEQTISANSHEKEPEKKSIKEVTPKKNDSKMQLGSPKSLKRPTLVPSATDIKHGNTHKKQGKSSKALSKEKSVRMKTNGLSKKSKSPKVDLPSDSDSDLDVPLSQLKNSPKIKKSSKIKKSQKVKTSGASKIENKTPKKISNSSSALKLLSKAKRSPKVKISHAKSPKLKNKVPGEKELKQKTLFDFRAQMSNEPSFAEDSKGIIPSNAVGKQLGVVVDRIDWKGLTEEEREKIRQQKRDEWNKIRRERQRMLKQKHDDLELLNITPLPAAKPIKMEGGLQNTAFGDIAMIVEFIHEFNKFLAPEETPVITAELLIKALAAGGQGACVISKILLVFLRTLIGEEEKEINGLGIGLADMPLTEFTVSELLYHYLKFNCDKPVKKQRANGSKDDSKDDTKDDAKDEFKENSKDGPKEKSKDDSENDAKDESKVDSKNDSKDEFDVNSKDDSKENSQADAKDISKDDPKDDDDDDDDDASSITSVGDTLFETEEMPKRIISYLEKNEFFTLSATEQLKVLVFLFYKIVDSEYYLEYLESLKMETKELWRQQDAFRKKAAKERKEEQSKSNENKNPTAPDSMKIDQFTTKVENGSKTAETDVTQKSSENEKEEGKNEKEEEKSNVKKEKKEEKKVEIGKNLETKADDELMKDYPKEPVADLVHIVRQRRVMAAKQAALKDEEDRKEKERRKEMDELQQKLKKIQAWKDGLDRCKRSLRVEPIGLDRHFKLYWVFSNGMPGIYVEDGWMYHAVEKRTIDSWEYYDTVEDVDKLLKALAAQGIRESALKTCLNNQYKAITSVIKKRNPGHFELQPYDVFEESIKILKEDMLESGNKIVKGALGMIFNQEQWEKKVEEGKTLEEMIPLLLELQQSVLPKFLQGTMDHKSKGEQVVKHWTDNVKAVKTMSALHTLLGILENCVKWDKSAENVKCKICRRKAGDDYLVLCDECNRGYHPYCLRPALLDFPVENWRCPACEPLAPASRARTRRKEEPIDYEETANDGDNVEEEETDEDQSEGEGESDHESLCHVCGEDGELICCDHCPKVYHLDCHEPPIRRLPRGIWICFVCRNPKMATRFRRAQEQIAKSSKVKAKASKAKKKQERKTSSGRTSRRARYSDPTDEDEEEEEEQSDSSEAEGDSDDSGKNARSRRRGTRKRQEPALETSDDDEEPSVKRRKRGRGEKTKRKRQGNFDTDDEGSDPSPKTRRKKKSRETTDEDIEEEAVKPKKRGRISTKQSRYNDASDSDEEVTKARRATRKRNASEEGAHNDGTRNRRNAGRNKRSEERSPQESQDLGFGRRARNRNRGQNSEILACENILRGLWKSEFSFHFREPVDAKKVPDYEKFVSNPIDLSKIRDKLDMLEYEDAFQFVDDVKLMFENSANYNEDNSEVANEAKKLEREFFNLLKEYLPGLHNSLCVNT